jgi:hypothetical protein
MLLTLEDALECPCVWGLFYVVANFKDTAEL